MSFLSVLLLVILLIAVFFITVMAIDTHRLVVRRYSVLSSKLKKNVRIVFLSDLHSKTFGKNNEKLIEKIKNEKPDLIIVGGDMYTAMKSENASVALGLLPKLVALCPVYMANGNHEQKTKLKKEEFNDLYDRYLTKAKELNTAYLENDSVLLNDLNIRIYGLELPFMYYRKLGRENPGIDVLKKCLGDVDKDSFCILSAHNPQYFDDYAAWGADLTLSGHVHGGLVRLPIVGGVLSPNYRFFPRYSGGRYDIADKTMVLSCGLGTHHLPLRVFNPGEISVIDCKSIS